MKNYILLLTLLATMAAAGETTSPYAKWTNGPPASPDFFPIAVWVQGVHNAARYKAAGVNTYVGLWAGPTVEQLDALEKAGLHAVCAQNEVGLKNKDRKCIIAWMHGDEPDNAQGLPNGKGYGPPVPTADIIRDYEALKEKDPSRPILLNLGQGVAWDKWHGRGVRTNKPEDYPEYVKGSDIVSFDIYPASHDNKEVAGNLWFVAKGVNRLVGWGEGKKIVWCCIETTRISNENRKPAPHEVKAEVWMAIVHGATGLIYFCHQFKPKFIEAGLLAEPEILKEVTAVNKRIHALAPVLNSPTITEQLKVESSPDVPVATLVKRHGGATYVFAVAMRNGKTPAKFKLSLKTGAQAEVIDENRTVPVTDGAFEDSFDGYGVHLYRIADGN